VGFNATNDKLILDTDITLRGDITATNKVIGTVAGLEYTYSSQTCNEAVAEADSLPTVSI
jgi:hypothetical protein